MTERRNNQRSTTLQGRAHEAEALTHPVIASRRRGNLINIIMKLKKPSTLKRLESSQRGIGLVELIIAIAITGIIGAAATMAIHQVLTGTALSNDLNTAINNVQLAGYLVNRDALQAQEVMLDDPDTSAITEFLTLSWTDWDSNDKYRIAYTLEGMPSGDLKYLRRREAIHDKDGNLKKDEFTGPVPQYIYVDTDPTKPTNCV